MAIGAGFQDVALQIQLSEVQNRQTWYRQRESIYQRRMQREDQQYEYKRTLDEYERKREQAGAGMVGILANPDLTKKQRYEALMEWQGQFPNVDLAGTAAGRGMLGAYGTFGNRSGGVPQYSFEYYKSRGLTPEQSQQALERKHLGAEGTSFPGKMSSEEAQITEYMDAKTKAEEAGDTLKVSLIDEKLSQMPRYKQLQDRVHGPTRNAWLSEMEYGGFSEFVDTTLRQTVKGKWGTSDKRYGPKAYADALKKAVADGYSLGLPAEKITAAFNRWWDKEHKKNVDRWQTYADRSKFSPQETASEAELLGGMTDRISSDKATKYQGYDPRNVQTVAPAKGWTDEQYGDELTDMDGDVLGGPGDKKPTPGQKITGEGQFRDPQLQAIWERAKKQGITIEQFRAELNK